MSSSKADSSSGAANILDTQIKFNVDLGRDIVWNLVSTEIHQIRLNPYNNRFAPDAAMSSEEHEQLIIQEDIVTFGNLRKSMTINPQLEPLIGYIAGEERAIQLISGHRRYFAAQKEKIETVLVWVAHDLTEDEIEQVRDWPEIHQTKVQHSSYAKHKAISNDLKNRNEIDRERRISVWRQKGYSRQQILKSERIFGRIEAFCANAGEKTFERASQVKAFETYDTLVEKTFAPLRDQGDYDRVVVLDKLAKSFLKHNIAHDDLKVAVEGLAQLPKTDPIYNQAKKDPKFLEDLGNLRRVTNLARSLKHVGSVEEEVRDFTSRIFSKLIDRADEMEMQNVVKEFQDTATRLNTVISNLQGRGGK